MQAIVLASGVGKRLAPLTDTTSKCLLPLGGDTILSRIFDSLLASGITDIIVTTGHKAGEIERYIAQKYSTLAVRYAHNDRYRETNYIYSLWLAREFFSGDMLLIHGDLVFHRGLIKKVLKAAPSNVLIHRSRPGPEKDFRARVDTDRVKEIRVGLDGDDVRACMPLYYFLEKDRKIFMSAVERMVQQGKTSIYAEDALNTVLSDIILRPVYFQDDEAMEVDDHEDLGRARAIVEKKEI